MSLALPCEQRDVGERNTNGRVSGREGIEVRELRCILRTGSKSVKSPEYP